MITSTWEQELSDEIDQEIIDYYRIQYFLKLGWTHVVLSYLTWVEIKERREWCVANISHACWYNSGSEFVFANSKDATMYILKWA